MHTTLTKYNHYLIIHIGHQTNVVLMIKNPIKRVIISD
jgi:hypothetical protein